MATYTELASIYRAEEWTQLIEKIRVACSMKATTIINSPTPAASSLTWAENAIKNPSKAGDDIAFYVVSAVAIANPTVTLAQIYTATDSAVQDNVDAAIDALYGA